jgi:arylsulfatase A-like enzyme/Flp pilus assembly protein TadD
MKRIALSFLFLLSLSCGEADKKPNLLIVTLDTTRSDYISCMGGTKARTPHIDSLAKKGALFSRAFTTAPLTLPAHTSLMTGLYPPGHGVRTNGMYRLDENIPTLADVLFEEGYETGAVIGSVVLESQFGLDSGFGHYDDRMPELEADRPPVNYLERKGEEVTDAAIAFLEEAGGSPFFLWVHYFDPHHPYDPPPPFDREYSTDHYAGEIAFVDACVGRLLAWIDEKGRGRNTMVVIVGDHGESLGDHGENSHGVFLYESTMRVPLVMAFPGRIPENTVCKEAVSIADVCPTVLDFFGIEAAGLALQGKSVRSFLGESGSREVPLYIETRFSLECMGWSPLEGVILGDWKYIRAPHKELYDLEADPGETKNLIALEEERGHMMEALLDSLEGSLTKEEAGLARFAPDEETLEKLRSLGYVTSPATEGPGLRDPKDMIPLLATTEKGAVHLRKGDYARAERACREALEIDPTNVTILNYLGLSLSSMGQNREAIEVWKKALRISPGSFDVHLNIGMAYLSLGSADSALSAYDMVLVKNPHHTDALLGKGKALRMSGKLDLAIEVFEKATREKENSPAAHFLLGLCYREKGEPEKALPCLEKALSLNPRMKKAKREKALALIDLGEPERAVEIFTELRDEGAPSAIVLVDLGYALEKCGRMDEALARYRKATELDSASWLAYNNMGALLAGMGRADEAEAALLRAIALAPQMPQAYYNLAGFLARAGRKEEAREAYATFLSLWRGDDETRRKVEREMEGLTALAPR